MDFNAILQAISTVGFPIACCIYLIYSNNKSNEQHTEQVEKLRQTIDNNTKVMIKICSKMGVDEDA